MKVNIQNALPGKVCSILIVLIILQSTYWGAAAWSAAIASRLNSLATSITTTRVGVVAWRTQNFAPHCRYKVIFNLDGNAPVANNGLGQVCIGVAKIHFLLAFVTELDVRVTR